jgi:stringent starvation protein B
MPPTRLPRKKDVAVALLEQSSVFVHLDPRAERVSVPTWFKKQPQLVLQIGLNMAIPIPDLHLDDDGLSCTLSFNRTPHHCVVPWSSVYALVGEDGRGMVWPDDVPPEVAAQMQQKAAPKPKLAAVAQGAPDKAPAKKLGAAEKKAAEPTPVGQSARGAAAATTTVGQSARGAAAATTTERQQAKPPTKKKRSRRKTEKGPAPKALAPVPDEPAEAQQAARGSAKGKRELPPYLRVIK